MVSLISSTITSSECLLGTNFSEGIWSRGGAGFLAASAYESQSHAVFCLTDMLFSSSRKCSRIFSKAIEREASWEVAEGGGEVRG